jgi:tryptophanyl-tRNA synthetase
MSATHRAAAAPASLTSQPAADLPPGPLQGSRVQGSTGGTGTTGTATAQASEAQPLTATDRAAVPGQPDPRGLRMLTGDRPTGRLHLGHYFGSLCNRVRLQRLGAEVFVVIADYQVLTDRDVGERVGELTEELVIDYLATGIDPDRATIFAHSAVPAIGQLMLPFLSLVTVAELGRNPTVRDEIAHSAQTSVSGLMFTYPVHQAADILSCQANLVPVGQDQLPHVELTRTIARRFNGRYADGAPVLPVPEPLLSAAPLLPGTDGGKMSKSRGNAVALGCSEDETAALIRGTVTDSRRQISYDPAGRPGVSGLVLLTALCLDQQPEQVAAGIGAGGAARLKQVTTEAVNEHLRPLRARRREFAADRGYIRRVLQAGNAHAAQIAAETLASVQAAMATR